jgi:hypothetical protein
MQTDKIIREKLEGGRWKTGNGKLFGFLWPNGGTSFPVSNSIVTVRNYLSNLLNIISVSMENEVPVPLDRKEYLTPGSPHEMVLRRSWNGKYPGIN